MSRSNRKVNIKIKNKFGKYAKKNANTSTDNLEERIVCKVDGLIKESCIGQYFPDVIGTSNDSNYFPNKMGGELIVPGTLPVKSRFAEYSKLWSNLYNNPKISFVNNGIIEGVEYANEANESGSSGAYNCTPALPSPSHAGKDYAISENQFGGVESADETSIAAQSSSKTKRRLTPEEAHEELMKYRYMYTELKRVGDRIGHKTRYLLEEEIDEILNLKRTQLISKLELEKSSQNYAYRILRWVGIEYDLKLQHGTFKEAWIRRIKNFDDTTQRAICLEVIALAKANDVEISDHHFTAVIKLYTKKDTATSSINSYDSSDTNDAIEGIKDDDLPEVNTTPSETITEACDSQNTRVTIDSPSTTGIRQDLLDEITEMFDEPAQVRISDFMKLVSAKAGFDVIHQLTAPDNRATLDAFMASISELYPDR